MKIQSQKNISFGRTLTPKELTEYELTLKQAKEKVGQTGKSLLIIHDACLPKAPELNTGAGHLSSQESSLFWDFVKSYMGINTIEVLPQGQVYPYQNVYCAYSGTALSLGNHQINLGLLQTPEYGSILKENEFLEVVKANNAPNKEYLVNWKNVMDNDSPQDKALRKAFERFSQIDSNSNLKRKYFEYCKNNNDWLTPKSLFEILSKKYGTNNIDKWNNELDQNLYSIDENQRNLRIAELLKENKNEADFYKFKQFLADEHLKIGKNNINKKGMQLYGDFLVGFSYDEVWAFPKAFKKDHFMGIPKWKIPALDFDNILIPGSYSNQLLKRKIQLYAQRYDSVRIDAAWGYITPIISPKGIEKVAHEYKKPMGSAVLDMMEGFFREIKGNNFNIRDLIYEFEASPDEFNMWENGDLMPAVKSRTKAFSTTYMHEYPGDAWGSNDAFLKRGWSADSFSIGVGNHDPQPLRQIAERIPDKEFINGYLTDTFHKDDAVRPLAQILKLDENLLWNNPAEFAKAKFAEPMSAKNNHIFYMDVFGRLERFNVQHTADPQNYSYKIPYNYKESWLKSIKEGFGFNPMDALEKLFRAKGLDNSEPQLFSKILKFKELLLAPEEILNNSENTAKTLINETLANVKETSKNIISNTQNMTNEIAKDTLNEKEIANQVQRTIANVNKNKVFKPLIVAGSVLAIAGISFCSYIIGRKQSEQLNQKQKENIPQNKNEVFYTVKLDDFLRKTTS